MMRWLRYEGYSAIAKNLRCARYLAASVLLSLSACASLPYQSLHFASPASNDGAKLAEMSEKNFARQGRFAMRVSDAQGDLLQTLQGSFSWLEFSQSDLSEDKARQSYRAQLDLSSPFGQTLARLQIEPQQATLFQADKPPEYAEDVDALVFKLLGWPLSVKAFPYWLRGQTQQLQAKESVNDRIAQDQLWQLDMRDFDAFGPTRLSIKRMLNGGQTLELKLVITAP